MARMMISDATLLASDVSTATTRSTWLATSLGYLIGFGSLMLYTPIAIRLYRQKSANGTTLSTWWLKLAAYTCSDTYFFRKGYPLSTYIETLIITLEAAIILGLVTYYQSQQPPPPPPPQPQPPKPYPQQQYQQQHPQAIPPPLPLKDEQWNTLWIVIYLTVVAYGLTLAPPGLLAFGQGISAILTSAALIPQFRLNYKLQSKGDYSPITASLAATGCTIRLYTITQLADSDPILLASFGSALILNVSLLLQIIYYGVAVEGLTLLQVFSSDVTGSTSTAATAHSVLADHDSDDDVEGGNLEFVKRSDDSLFHKKSSSKDRGNNVLGETTML